MCCTSQAWSPAHPIILELSEIKIFSFCADFGQICEFWWFSDGQNHEKSWHHEKISIFSKSKSYDWYGHQIWTPNSSWAQSYPKSRKYFFFIIKKKYSVNSLIFTFKGNKGGKPAAGENLMIWVSPVHSLRQYEPHWDKWGCLGLQNVNPPSPPLVGRSL